LKFAGYLMLISGWVIVLAALVLIPEFALRASFIAAGMSVEIIGLGLIARGQVTDQRQAQALAASIDGTRSASSLGGYRSGFGGNR
jgi:hypothetical protein